MNPYQSLVYAVAFTLFGALATVLVAWRLLRWSLRTRVNMQAFVRGMVSGYHDARRREGEDACVLCSGLGSCMGCGRPYASLLPGEEAVLPDDEEEAGIVDRFVDTITPEQITSISPHLTGEQVFLLARLHQHALARRASTSFPPVAVPEP